MCLYHIWRLIYLWAKPNANHDSQVLLSALVFTCLAPLKNKAATGGQSQQFLKKGKKRKENGSRNCCDSCQQLSAPSEMMKNWLRSAGEGSRRNTSHCISTPAPSVSESRNLRNMCPQFMQAEGYSGHPFQPINIPLFRIVLLNAHCSLAREISMTPLSIMLQWEMLNLKTDKWIHQKECIMTAGSSSND